ncbi:Lrp/AsnC family transcriptional regulator [Shinella sp. WSJ-2]|uniref:Lrp/AsnC family transcriptional regulator n=1 Tax=Shinella sp. WSJ-2 TaxID=2303749 RepID=UPI000E3E2EE2|nr:Lrp/AsnC family transcriptional regulator [Shinella sp. WSJ-2]MBO9629143.1 Lrp/AsnC family transcriptional regulator [Shinella sp.]RFZ87288.1 Lrp/AsnC family transcriptional regulator [Shinella sp. WSJ-2]
MPASKSVLDPASVRILDLLQENAEMSIADLAEATGLSASPCWRRINELKESGVIKGTVALVDAPSLGLAVNVFVQVSLKQQDRQSLDIFDAAIRTKPEIVECYLMTGEADYMLRVVVEDLSKFQALVVDFLTLIPCVANIRSSFALSQIKYTTALPTEHLRGKK